MIILIIFGAVTAAFTIIAFAGNRWYKSAIGAAIVTLILMICVVVTAVHTTNEEKEFYENFENGVYTIDVEKCFEVYDETDAEGLQKIITSMTGKVENQITIQKSNDEKFVITVDDNHFIVSTFVMQELAKNEAIFK